MYNRKKIMENISKCLVLLCIISMATSMQIKQTFRDYIRQRQSSFFHMTVDEKSGDVFVGATNYLYKLSSDLDVLQIHTTGPRLDNIECPPPSEACNLTKTYANTYVKGLAIDYNENSLIMCSSLFQGFCQILSTKNITNVKKEVYKPLISNSPVATHLFLVAKGIDSKDVLYVGNMHGNHFGNVEYQDQVPHLSSREMTTLDLSYQDEEGGTSVFLYGGFRFNTTVDFVYGFSYKGFVYFIAVNQGRESRIIRLCQEDKYFNSYIEIPLRCEVGQEKMNTYAQAASYDPVTGKLYVAFRDLASTASSLCNYKMSDTEFLFDITAKYCYNGTGFLGPTHIQPKEKCQKSNSAPDFCGRTLVSRNYSAIEGQHPLYAQPFIEFPKDVLTSMAILAEDNHTDIFLGDSAGSLKRVVVSGTKASVVDTIEFDWNLSVKKEMFFSPDKKSLYAMTSDKVYQVDISREHCVDHLTCDTCMQSTHPLCGWCVMDNRCTDINSCKKQAISPHWLPAGQSTCSQMLEMSPNVVSFEQIQNTNAEQKISFKMGNLVLSSESSDLDLQCAFTATAARTNTKATNQDTYVTCPLPDSKHFDMKPMDFKDIDVSLHVSGRSIVKRSITMFDCTVHKSCTSCTQSVWQCAWQYQSHSCVSLSIISSSQQNVAINVTDSCPRVESPSLQDADIFVHSGGTKQISVKLTNMQPGQTSDMKCKFNYLDTTIVVDGSVSAANLVCDPVMFGFNNTDMPYVQASFDVLWGTNQYTLDMPRPITVRIFKCELMVTNCGQCLSMDTKYDCGWCGDRCLLQNDCPTDKSWLDRTETCPNPQILRFNPSTGPVNGRVNITVHGINLGKAYTDIRDGVTVAGVKCTVFPEHYEPSTRFKCITNVANEVKEGKIMVSVDNKYNYSSDSLFKFVKPMVTMMVPKRGPRSGGTSITIYGTHIDTGTQTTVDVGGSPCEVKRLNFTEIICVTSQQVSSKSQVDVTVDFGGYERLLTQNFTYVDDPVISNISPMESLVSGGIILRVLGERLNLIQMPVLFAEGSIENTTCDVMQIAPQVLKAQWLSCPTPAIRVSNGNMSDTNPLKVHFGFKLDGVTTWYNISKMAKFGPLSYYADPYVELLPDGSDMKKYSESENLVIKGLFHNVNPLIHSVKVLVGKEDCIDKTMSEVSITCTPPKKPDGLDHRGHAPVTLKIGFFRKDVGYLNYSKKTKDEKPIAMGIILGVVLPIIAIIILLTICIIRRQRKTKPPESGIPDMLKDEETRKEEEEIGMNHVSVKADMNGQIPDDDSGPYISELLAGITDEGVRQNVSDLLIPRSKLDIGELIGKGSYGNTYEAQYKTSKGADAEEQAQPVAVKSLQGCSTDNESIVSFLQHCATLKDLQHPNLLSLLGVSLSAAEEPLIVRPHLQRGDLKNYVKDPSKNLTVLELLEMSSQISEALAYLEGLHIVHRNLAARNCLVTDDKVVKVSDFSITQLYSTEYYNMEENKNKLVIKWWAPESIDSQQFTHKSDVWSFGILLWELLTRGVTPYPNVEPKDLKDYLVGGHRLKKPRQCPESLYLLMLQCWTDMPEDRPTFQEVGKEIALYISTNEESPDDKQPLKAKIEPGGSQEYLEVIG